ncbi:hypothetical protein GOBAR_DD24669 [Gossypium barbadense]|nr:hypothetical protein GOBAR_DD24669 [Gossypium barbadense]
MGGSKDEKREKERGRAGGWEKARQKGEEEKKTAVTGACHKVDDRWARTRKEAEQNRRADATKAYLDITK